jgi:hypothetical protein
MTATTRGAQLLETLAQPHIHALVERYGQPPQRPTTPRPRKPADPSHGRRQSPADTVPADDLHRALTGRAGPERLRRFAVAMTYPTITETARALGVSNATIIQTPTPRTRRRNPALPPRYPRQPTATSHPTRH